MELIYFIKVLLRRKWLILAITSIAMVTTFLISSQAPPVYEAKVRLATGITEDTSNPVFSLEKSGSALKHEIEGKFRTMEENILSDPSLFLLGYQLMIHDLNNKFPFRSLTPLRRNNSAEELQVLNRQLKRKRDSLTSLSINDELEKKHIESMRQMEYDPESLRKKLVVRRVAGTDFIGIDARFEKPELSAFAANTLAQEFSRYHVNTHAKVAENSLELLEKLVKEKRDDFNAKMQTWDGYTTEKASENESPTRSIVYQIDRLTNERERANKTIFDAQQKLYDADKFLPEAAQISFLDPGSRGIDNSVLLRNRIERLNYRYIRGNMVNRALRDSIRMTRRELTEILLAEANNRVPNASGETRSLLRNKIDAEIQLEISRKRIVAINQEVRVLTARAGNIGADEYSSDYGKEVQLARDAYFLSLNQWTTALALIGAPDLALERVSQVEHVLPPQKPLPSKTLVLTVLAGLVALGLSMGIIFLIEYLDTSIKHPASLKALTGMEVIGSLNKLKN
ncbi:MAG: Wzz/FepE/Etk N-terminal domain-containing protein, partial [Bacteroidota bacterium]